MFLLAAHQFYYFLSRFLQMSTFCKHAHEERWWPLFSKWISLVTFISISQSLFNNWNLTKIIIIICLQESSSSSILRGVDDEEDDEIGDILNDDEIDTILGDESDSER